MKRLVGVLALLAIATAHGGGQRTPETTVKDFYTWEIHGPFGSDKSLLGPVRNLLTPELDALMTATDNYQNACRKLVPADVKPWILDGDPWYYYSADGARAIDGTELLSATDQVARVAAKLSYDESKWTDTVILIKVNGSWRIADIRFQQGGGLIHSLRGYFSRSCGRT